MNRKDYKNKENKSYIYNKLNDKKKKMSESKKKHLKS